MLLSLRAYAKHRKENGLPGGSLAAVQKAIASGRIKPAKGGKIDAARADAQWAQRTDPAQQRETIATSKERSAPSAAAKPATVDVDLGAEPDMDPGDYQKSRAANEYWEARGRRLKTLADEKRFADLDRIKSVALSLTATLQGRLRAVGSKLAPELAAEVNPAVCQELVDNEILEALSQISRWEPGAA